MNDNASPSSDAGDLSDTQAGAKAPMRPVGLALELIERVAELQPISASDIARRLGVPKATAHRLLLALEHFGWLERDGGSRPLWSVSTRPIAVGGRAIERKSGLRIAALPIMDALRHATGETVHLGLVNGETMLLIERLDGVQSVSVFLPVGTSWDLSWSSAGKSVLAYQSDAQREAFLRTPRFRRRSETEIIPVAELSAELANIRERGFAISVGRPPALSSSIGTAIFDKYGRPFAGLSITGSSSRLREEQLLALAPQLVDAARRISIGMSMD